MLPGGVINHMDEERPWQRPAGTARPARFGFRPVDDSLTPAHDEDPGGWRLR